MPILASPRRLPDWLPTSLDPFMSGVIDERGAVPSPLPGSQSPMVGGMFAGKRPFSVSASASSPTSLPPLVPPQSEGQGFGALSGPPANPDGGSANSGDNQPMTAATGGIFGKSATPYIPAAQLPMAQPTVSGDLPTLPKAHPKFFQHGGLGEKILGGLGEFALSYSASNGDPRALAVIQNRMMSQRYAMEAQARERERQQEHAWHLDDRDYAANRPVVRNVGNELTTYDPATGQVRLLYQGMSPEEEYVRGLGLDPNSDEGRTALQDYVLRGNGPTAYGYDSQLEGIKQGNRVGLENVRQGNRMNLRGSPTYSNLHPRTPAPKPLGDPKTVSGVIAAIMNKQRAGQPLTPQESAMYEQYWRGKRNSSSGMAFTGSPSAPTAPAQAASGPPTAVDPKTGHTVVWNGKAWVSK